MKLELKKVKINLAFSEETIMFRADVYIDGEHIGEAENEGRGGCTWVTHLGTEKSKQVLQNAFEHFKTLPPHKFKDGGGREYEIDSSLDGAIDDIIAAIVNEKERKSLERKMAKSMEKGLVYSKGVEGSFNTITWGKWTMAQLMAHPEGRKRVEEAIAEVTQKGYKVLNNNIPQLTLKP